MLRPAIVTAVALLLLCGAGNGRARATPGELDPSFGMEGVVQESFGSRFRSVVRMPNGKIVAAGEIARPPGTDFLLVRYLENGEHDPEFGVGGVVQTSLGASAFAAVIDLAPVADGRLIAAGNSDPDTVVARYLAGGELDPSFGVNGVATYPNSEFVLSSPARNLAVQADGRIVLAGAVLAPARLGVLRFTAAGLPDASFGSGGVASLPGIDPRIVAAVAIQADGRILAGAQTPAGVVVARFTAGGMPDPEFGAQGLADTPLDGACTPGALLVQADGRILVAGSRADPADPSLESLAVARLLPNGGLDSTFGSGGLYVPAHSPLQLGTFLGASALLRDPAGRLVVGGRVETAGGVAAGIARLTAASAFDVHFGDAGAIATASGISGEDHAILVQPDAKVVEVGAIDTGASDTTRAVIARYLGGRCGDGFLDPGEECDDGNLAAGDACNPDCTRSRVEIPFVSPAGSLPAIVMAALLALAMALRWRRSAAR